jgi:hypothetical protein
MTETTVKDRSREATVIPMGQRIFLISGLLFLFGALAFFGISAYVLLTYAPLYVSAGFETLSSEGLVAVVVTAFVPLLFLAISAALCVFVGLKLLVAAGAVSAQVIPPAEYELLAPAIRDGNDDAISQYIRLSSLSGMTGTFTKIDLTGLPLATITLTVVLAILGIFSPQFFDLAQLTLGAFLGSYVQKRSEAIDIQQQQPPRSG